MFGLIALLPVAGPAREMMAASGSVEVAFTPWDDAEGAVLRAVAGARQAIFVQAFLLTSRPLARALLKAHERGVAVAVLADRDMAEKSEGSQLPALAAGGIPIALEVRYAAAHNKVILIDPEAPSCAVLTGSYNFTFSAQARNAENVLILRGNAALAAAYLANWKRHRADAVAFSPAAPESR